MYKSAIDRFYDGRGLVLYASKAFSCKAMCKIMAEEGLGLDVVSGGELYTAMQAGFPAERICFHGSHKSREEIQMALDYGVGRFVIDNDLEVQNINELANGRKIKCLVRITPGVDAHTHGDLKKGA